MAELTSLLEVRLDLKGSFLKNLKKIRIRCIVAVYLNLKEPRLDIKGSFMENLPKKCKGTFSLKLEP